MCFVIRKSANRFPPVSHARRHFMGIVAAGAGRLSTIAVASSLLAAFKVGDANASGGHRDRNDNQYRIDNHHCFGRGTLIRTAHGEAPVEDLAIGTLVMTANGVLPVKWIGRKSIRKNSS